MVIDSTNLTIEEVLEVVLAEVRTQGLISA
jgi:hypothetical protein